MKRIMGLGLIISALAMAPQQAQAWTNFKFGVGLNLEWSSGNNSLAWGLWHDGLRHGPAVPHYHFNPFNCLQGQHGGYGYPHYGYGYGNGFGNGYAGYPNIDPNQAYANAPAAQPAAKTPVQSNAGQTQPTGGFTNAYYQPVYYQRSYYPGAYPYYQPVAYYGYGYGNYGYGW